MTLTHMNIHIAQLSRFILALERRAFTVARDDDHWSKTKKKQTRSELEEKILQLKHY